MLIELKRNWFGPSGKSYRAKVGSGAVRHSVTEETAKLAPSDALVFTDQGEPLGTRKEWSNTLDGAAALSSEEVAGAGDNPNPLAPVEPVVPDPAIEERKTALSAQIADLKAQIKAASTGPEKDQLISDLNAANAELKSLA